MPRSTVSTCPRTASMSPDASSTAAPAPSRPYYEAKTASMNSAKSRMTSKSKRARFRSRLHQLGLGEQRLDRLVCPVGIGAIQSRLPAAIAVSVAAQLLAVSGDTPHMVSDPALESMELIS